MMENNNKKYKYTLVIKKDTTENWDSSEYIPQEGESCYDIIKKVIRVR